MGFLVFYRLYGSKFFIIVINKNVFLGVVLVLLRFIDLWYIFSIKLLRFRYEFF